MACGSDPIESTSETHGTGGSGGAANDASSASDTALDRRDNVVVDAVDGSSRTEDGAPDTTADASLDAGLDASLDAGFDASLDAGLDASPDATAEALADVDDEPTADVDHGPVCPELVPADTAVLRFIRPLPPPFIQGVDLCAAELVVDDVYVRADASLVVGSSWYNIDGDAGSVAYRHQLFEWSSATGTQAIGFLPGDASIDRQALIDHVAGDVVAIFAVQDEFGGDFGYPFRWSPAAGLVPIGLLAGFDQGKVTDSSADGSLAVGWARSSGGGEASGFSWTPSGGIMPIDALRRHLAATPAGVTPSGSAIVGDYVDDPDTDRGAFRLEGSNWLDLPKLPSSNRCAAGGMSDDGTVIVGGCSPLESPFESRAFIWTEPSAVTAPLVPNTTADHYASYVSPDGTAVLGGIVDAPPDGGPGPLVTFRWTQSTGLVILRSPDGRAFAGTPDPSVRDAHRMIGSLQASDDGFEAAVWSEASGAVGLGYLPGDNQSEISAFSANGKNMCGLSYKRPSGGERSDDKPVYWDDTGIHSLAVELIARGADLSALEAFDCRWIGNGSPLVLAGNVKVKGRLTYYGWVATLSP
jgi:hypothetical protein